MSLTGIHHVALVVEDADAALGFYCDLLGLRVRVDRVIEEQGVRGVLLPMPGELGSAECEIEIIQPVHDGTGVAKFLRAQGEGLHHVCLQSTDVAADLTAAEASGQQMIDQTPRAGLAGRIGFIHPRSNHGVLVEYAQPPDGEEAHGPQGVAAPLGLDHLVSVVNDPAASAQDFAAHFGFRETATLRQPQVNVSSCLLDLGGSVLELATPITPDDADPVTRRLARGEGLFMVAVRVADVAGAVAHLRRAGVKCTDPIELEGQQRAFLSPKPAHGVRLQLVGP
jgi:methylmalonyl-CoA/ethylmalonyl-CoA epimerase